VNHINFQIDPSARVPTGSGDRHPLAAHVEKPFPYVLILNQTGKAHTFARICDAVIIIISGFGGTWRCLPLPIPGGSTRISQPPTPDRGSLPVMRLQCRPISSEFQEQISANHTFLPRNSRPPGSSRIGERGNWMAT
jgi:hypothetical protein